MSAYDALAAIYDRWQDRYGRFSSTVLERLERELDGFREVASFLDLGCGTGSLLLGIGARHPQVQLVGVDGSRAMIACAQSKPGADRVSWKVARLGEPLGTAPVSVVGSFFNTLNHLPSLDELGTTLRTVAEVLPPGGRFLFDVNNAVGFAHWWRGVNRCAGQGWRLRIRSSFDTTEGRAQARLRLSQPSGSVEVTVDERLFSDDEIASLLARLGFAVIAQEVWAPLGDGVAGSTFWHTRRGGHA